MRRRGSAQSDRREGDSSALIGDQSPRSRGHQGRRFGRPRYAKTALRGRCECRSMGAAPRPATLGAFGCESAPLLLRLFRRFARRRGPPRTNACVAGGKRERDHPSQRHCMRRFTEEDHASTRGGRRSLRRRNRSRPRGKGRRCPALCSPRSGGKSLRPVQ